MRTRTTRAVGAAALLIAAASPALAQNAQPAATDAIAFSGSIRARSYSWDWFGSDAGGEYSYPASLMRVAAAQTRATYDWQVELAVPFVTALPTNAVLTTPQGQLGLGASYFAANDNATMSAALFLKQGFFRWKRPAGPRTQSLTIGRMEFNEGAEVTPKNATLAAVKRERISQRLLGNFSFSDVGRSIDGAVYSASGPKLNVTALAGRPTQGVFEVNGWPELNINVFYGAVTQQTGAEKNAGEWTVFTLAYDDYRHGAAKTDNRPPAAKSADTGTIAVETYGGHLLEAVSTAAGPIDLLAWGAAQAGSWGSLTQRAAAFAVEGGWQPARFTRIKPWIRGGYDFASGDGNPGDQTHGTFFQVLPTPRIYARLPFFNMMNSRDAFGELIVRPARRLTVRTDVHALRLANANDLWYAGGGAFQPQTFGYTGRPSNGQSALATLYDVSGDYTLNAHLAVDLYYGVASSGAVVNAIYPTGNGLRLGYGEVIARF